MKTPIEELIEILKANQNDFANAFAIKQAEKYLPKEKEHICEAFSAGVNEGLNGLVVYQTSMYYDKKYNK